MISINKVVRPLDIIDDEGHKHGVFCKVQYTDGKLSISGVVGPKRNGDAWGSCGQIEMSFDEYPEKSREYAGGFRGWNKKTFEKFLQVWRAWHLNDMKAACEHQRAAGWEQLAGKKVTLYNFRLSPEIREEIREAEAAALDVVKTGQPFTPSKRQVYLSNLPEDLKLVGPAAPPEYVPNGPHYTGDNYNRATEEKTLGWLKTSEHPDGILSRPCPACGYEYGSAWLKVEVPAPVLKFLQELPDADRVPAWV